MGFERSNVRTFERSNVRARVGTARRDERGAVDVECGDASEVGAWMVVVVSSVSVWGRCGGGFDGRRSSSVVGRWVRVARETDR